jgi:hypothetical protein
VKCRPRPSPWSVNSRQAGPEWNRPLSHFWLKNSLKFSSIFRNSDKLVYLS